MAEKIEELDSLTVTDRLGQQNHSLRGLLSGGVAFLVGGGPSVRDLPVGDLANRGLFSMGVNNVAASIRVNSFVCSDPPSKFSDAIWLDPSIMKFIPIPKLTTKSRGVLRTKKDGNFVELQTRTADCPNVWGFHRDTYWYYDDRFFTDPIAQWGNGGKGVEKTGNPKTLCTLLLGIRLLRYLGASTIFLVGVDFRMSEVGGYSFDQGRTKSAVSSNNSQYEVVNAGLCKMASDGVFNRVGLEIYNTNPASGLRAFQHVPFTRAVDFALKGFPKEIDLHGWYEKGEPAPPKKNENGDQDSSSF